MKNKSHPENYCPCGSEDTYANCCRNFHKGHLPDSALKLMRSRYSAYALGLSEYIIRTTHPGSTHYQHDTEHWIKTISDFCSHTAFEGLEILDFQEKGFFATVTFVAHLTQDNKDTSFTERSYFEKIKNTWFYRSGQLSEGRVPNLVTTNQLRLLPLAYYGNPILHKVADPITSITEDVRTLVEEMIETMDACDGIGIAAPQVHHSIKLFVIRKPVELEDGRIELKEAKVFINPEISMPSTETWEAREGCLSIPSIHSEVKRPKEVTIKYSCLDGNGVEERVSGWEARVIMHENDHINGILFIDHLEETERDILEPFLNSLKDRIHDGTEL